MKRLSVLVMALAAASLFVPACGGGGSGGGLSTGSFTKTVAPGAEAPWVAPFTENASIHEQHLFLAEDIQGSGNIESLSFRLDEPLTTSVNCPDLTVRMGHTSLGALTDTYASNVEEGMGTRLTVKTGSYTVPAGSGGAYFNVPLDTPFPYNGADNLVVEFERTEACDGVVTLEATALASTDVALHKWNTVDPTGDLYDNYITARFHFAGGDNTLDYGGLNNNSWPFNSALPKTQNLYLAGDIEGSGSLTGLAFQLNQPSTEQTFTYSVTMGHTTLSALGQTFDDNFNAGSPVTLADAATFTVPAGIPDGEWFWVPLPDGTFDYNGTDNLIVEVEVTAGSGLENLRVTNLAAGRRAYAFAGQDTAKALDGSTYHLKLRFNGGPIEVITDGGSSYIVPVGGFNEFIDQILYDNTALGTSGRITELGFRLNLDAAAFDHNDVNLVLGHTSQSSLGGTSFTANMESDRTEVFSGTISIPAGLKAGDWVTVPLGTPFDYDSTRNLVVQWDAPGFGTSNASRGHTYSSGRYVGHVDTNLGSRTSDTPSLSEDFILDLRLTVEK